MQLLEHVSTDFEQNRTSLQDVIMASKGLKSQKKRQMTQMDPKKLEAYQDLFYLLQVGAARKLLILF